MAGTELELVKNATKQEEYEKRARELVARMTPEEKVSQTLYHAPAIERLGIPAYNWWNEALHGVARAGQATVFPQSIGLAATFDEELAEKVGDAVSTEGRAKFNMQQRYGDCDIYKGLTFWSPNVNIFRDPRWGRGHETFGEDPYLTSRMGVRFVQGLQGHDSRFLKAAACAKHFAVHSGPEELRHEFDAKVSVQELFETYLPAFKACVQEGHVEAVMGAYNRVNGEPCCAHTELLEKILRKDWGFRGHVVSDCWALQDFHAGHHVTETPVESAALAMNHGCDLNCGVVYEYLLMAISDGRVREDALDEALVRLFTARMKLGVMRESKESTDKKKNPYEEIPYTVVESAPMTALNRLAAKKSLVLLKNEGGLLPLSLEKLSAKPNAAIGVIGPNADSRKALVGNYEGTSSRYVTVLEGIQDKVKDRCRILASEGCHLYKDRIQELAEENDRMAEVKEICALSDVVILCLGLDAGLEGEQGDESNAFAGGDKPDLQLPGMQEKLLRTVQASGKPVVLLLLSGSALAVTWADAHVPAILQCWYPGAQGGNAIADVLFGDASPQGKLPVTFYRTTEELPDFTDYSMKGRTYRYMEQEALYPFGYGLSYTDFSYEGFSLSSDTLTEEGITVTGKVKNTGSREGEETVQAYVSAPHKKKGLYPHTQLKGVAKVRLLPGEEKEVSLFLPKEAFGLYDEEGNFTWEKGECLLFIGGQGPDKRSEALTGKKVLRFTIRNT